jgi:uncharacterized protein
MTKEQDKIRELPAVVPIFPLPGILLFPAVQLPLNIFEPRYLSMFNDALAGNRYIGMIQPSEVEDDPGTAPIHPVGCVGRISDFSETDDSRMLVTLTGVSRFRIKQEIVAITPYRQIEADYSTFGADKKHQPSNDSLDRKPLLDVLKSYFGTLGMEASGESLQTMPITILVNQLSMLCPFESIEKQALLESADITDRYNLLLNLMKMASHERPFDDDAELWTH